MSKVSIYLDKRNIKEGAECPVKIRVNIRDDAFFVTVPMVRVRPDEWDADKKKVIGRKDAKGINAYILSKKDDVEKTIMGYEMLGKMRGADLPRLKKRLEAVVTYGREAAATMEESKPFKEVFDAFISTKSEGNTKVLNNALRSFRLYDKKVETRPLRDFDEPYIRGFIKYMAEERHNMVNAINVHLRAIRAVMNYAREEGNECPDPFRRVKIKNTQTRKRNLSVEELRTLIRTEWPEHKRKYIDIFLLSFYLRGINMVDLWNARPTDIVDGRLEYDRQKTHTHYSVKIEPEAQAILDRYGCSERHIIGWMDVANGYTSWYEQICLYIRKYVGHSTYWARHTVASIGAEIGLGVTDIALILGHKDTDHSITLVYINFSDKRTDEAMRRIIDYVNEKPVTG